MLAIHQHSNKMVGVRGVAAAAIVVLMLMTVLACAIDFVEDDLASEEALRALYERWSAKYNVARPAGDKERRFRIFEHNARFVHGFNKRNNATSYTVALNLFGDMADDELESDSCESDDGSSDVEAHDDHPHSGEWWRSSLQEEDLPLRTDWRNKGAVTDPRLQGHCGACWAITAAAAVEGLHFVQNNELLTLSPQQLLDCDEDSGGCDGGTVINAFKSAADDGGLALESDYPYTAQNGTCRAVRFAARVLNYARVTPFSEQMLRAAVFAQPVAVSVDSHDKAFHRYRGGIFRGPCGSKLGHSMLVVGYNFENKGEEYWILKGTWGKEWGEDGFMRMYRGGTGQKTGPCGMFIRPSFPK